MAGKRCCRSRLACCGNITTIKNELGRLHTRDKIATDSIRLLKTVSAQCTQEIISAVLLVTELFDNVFENIENLLNGTMGSYKFGDSRA